MDKCEICGTEFDSGEQFCSPNCHDEAMLLCAVAIMSMSGDELQSLFDSLNESVPINQEGVQLFDEIIQMTRDKENEDGQG